MAFDQNKYIDDWTKANTDRVTIKIPKGKKELLQQTAQEYDKSMNQLVVQALEEQYNLDLSKPKYKKRMQKEL